MEEDDQSVKLNLLIVDDEWLDREGLLEQIPQSELPPMIIYTAANAAEAMEVVSRVPVDILLTDIQMPKSSGLDLVDQLRAEHREMQIIFISGHERFQYAKRALLLGAANYLLKPVEDEELLAALRLAIDRLPAARRDEVLPQRENSISEAICALVDANLSRDITLLDLSKKLHYSPNYLGKKFFSEKGVHFGEYLLKARMRRAAALIREAPHLRISDIAKMVGYKKSETFSRAFVNEYGVSPYAHRNQK